MTYYQWKEYYKNTDIKIINLSEPTEANTLALYRYGELTRPGNPADYMRDKNAPQVEVAVDGQKYFETLGRIIPYVMACKSDDIPNFLHGDYDSRFAMTNRIPVFNNSNLFRVELTPSQISTIAFTFDFRFVDWC